MALDNGLAVALIKTAHTSLYGNGKGSQQFIEGFYGHLQGLHSKNDIHERLDKSVIHMPILFHVILYPY